jgi:hypothetical protein
LLPAHPRWNAAEWPRPFRAVAGFADSLLATLGLESGLLEPEQLEGDLGQLYAAYRAELDRLGPLGSRPARRAVERLRSELDAWDGRPVFAYGSRI